MKYMKVLTKIFIWPLEKQPSHFPPIYIQMESRDIILYCSFIFYMSYIIHSLANDAYNLPRRQIPSIYIYETDPQTCRHNLCSNSGYQMYS